MSQTINQKETTARQAFKGFGRNFITPNIVKYLKKDNLCIEISSGSNPVNMKDTIYGVTVLELLPHSGTKKREDLNKSCQSVEEANEYVNTL